MSETTGTAFERVQNARHPQRPYSLDIFNTIFSDFVELHGDRRFADDSAMVCGFARLGKREVAVIGQQKGRDTKQRQQRNFGMPKPEGYRKALRIMKLAEKFGRPIITFIDTPGAYPGIDAEERGQAEAIAYNLREMAGIRVPIIVVVVGEGGSGGALAIGIGDRIIMLENAVYSVISPEGCAAILWKSAAEAPAAAEGLRLTADHLSSFGLIDEIVPEPESWAVSENDKSDTNVKPGKNEDIDSHYEAVANTLSASLSRHLGELEKMTGDELRLARFKKFRKMGVWV